MQQGQYWDRRVEIGVTAQYYSCVELPQRETGMADIPVKQVTRNPLSIKIDHLQDLSLGIVDTGWKLVEPDVVAMNPMTAKDDCPNDVKNRKKAEPKVVFALGVGSSLNRSTESYSRDEPNNDWNLASQTDQTWTAKSQYQKRWGAASNTPHP